MPTRSTTVAARAGVVGPCVRAQRRSTSTCCWWRSRPSSTCATSGCTAICRTMSPDAGRPSTWRQPALPQSARDRLEAPRALRARRAPCRLGPRSSSSKIRTNRAQPLLARATEARRASRAAASSASRRSIRGWRPARGSSARSSSFRDLPLELGDACDRVARRHRRPSDAPRLRLAVPRPARCRTARRPRSRSPRRRACRCSPSTSSARSTPARRSTR